MRKRISEKNKFPEFNVKSECKKIKNLFSESRCITYDDRFYTCEQVINTHLFARWQLRGTFISLNEMEEALGITGNDIESDDFNDDKALDFLQYIINCLSYIVLEIKANYRARYSNSDTFTMITNNTVLLIKRLGCFYTVDENTKEIFIQHTDDMANAVADMHPELERSLSEYRYHDNKGDLQRKAEILCSLYKHLESFNSRIIKKPENAILSETRYLFNATGIRHRIEKDNKASKPFLGMEDQELEQWYDKTFDLFVACRAIADGLDVIDLVKQLKDDAGISRK